MQEERLAGIACRLRPRRDDLLCFDLFPPSSEVDGLEQLLTIFLHTFHADVRLLFSPYNTQYMIQVAGVDFWLVIDSSDGLYLSASEPETHSFIRLTKALKQE